MMLAGLVNSPIRYRRLLRRRSLAWKTKLWMSTTPTKTLFAVGQINSTGDVAKNFDQNKLLIEKAASAGVKFFCLPENFSFLGSERSQSIAVAQAIESSPIIQKYQELAKIHSMWLSLGGFQEKSETPNKIYNTHIIVDDSGPISFVSRSLTNQGVIVAKYRKIHLFVVSIPGGPNLDESAMTSGGEETVVAHTPFGALGLSICYDLRFPHLYSNLTKAGAQILLVPSAFTFPTGQAHWEPLLRARAIENQCYVLASAQYGKHNANRESYGHSIIIDPWGRVVAECPDEAPCFVTWEVDLEVLQKIRTNMPVALHKRDDIYSRESKIIL